MDIPRSLMKSSSNSDIIRTSSIQKSAHTSLTYNFRYLGSTPMQLHFKSSTGFGSVIKPLKKMYLEHVLESRNNSQERLLVLEDFTLTIRYWDQRMKSFTRDVYPLSHVTYFDTARFQMLRLKKKVSNYGFFRRLSDAEDNFDLHIEGNMISIEKKHRKLLNALPQPPLIVIVLRRPRGVSFLDTHIFIAESDLLAQSFVHELALRILNHNENVASDIFQYERFSDSKPNKELIRNPIEDDSHGMIRPQRHHSYFGNVGVGALHLGHNFHNTVQLQIESPSQNQRELPPDFYDEATIQDTNQLYENVETSSIECFTNQSSAVQVGSQRDLQRTSSNVEMTGKITSSHLFKKLTTKSHKKLKSAKSMYELHRNVELEAKIGLDATKVGRDFQRELRTRARSPSPSSKDAQQRSQKRSIQDLVTLKENVMAEDTSMKDKRNSVSQLINNFEITSVQNKLLTKDTNTVSSSNNRYVASKISRHQQQNKKGLQENVSISDSKQLLSSSITSERTRIVITSQRLKESNSKELNNVNDLANELKMRQHTDMVKQTKAAEIEDDLQKMKIFSRKLDLQSTLGYLP